MKPFATLIGVLFLACAAGAQERPPGPLTPPPDKAVKRIPRAGTTPEAPMPLEEMVRRVTANEDRLRKIFDHSAYSAAIRIGEFDPEGARTGDLQLTTEVRFRPDGRRFERLVGEPESTLKIVDIAVEEVHVLLRVPLFVLTSDQLGYYDVAYAGEQPVDELKTYVFKVTPKHLDRRRPLYDGLLFVETRDLVVVKMYGKMVLETGDVAPDYPFTVCEIFRENMSGDVWLPSFLRSDDFKQLESGEYKLRLTARFSDYKLPAGTPGGSSGAPGPPKPPQP